MTRLLRVGTIDGAAPVPPSKSHALRALAASLLAIAHPADGPSRITPWPACDDARAALTVARGLGARLHLLPDGDETALDVEGLPKPHGPGGDLPCGESALCLRLFACVAALGGGPWSLTATGTLRHRSTDALGPVLETLGARFHAPTGRPPLTVSGPMRGGTVRLDARQTSQVLTGLLTALPSASEPSTLHLDASPVSRPYVDLTLRVLARTGVVLHEEDEGRTWRIPAHQVRRATHHAVEGDWSAAAFLAVAGALAGRVRVTGLDPGSVQGDRAVLAVLAEAGARVAWEGPDLTVAREHLRPFTFDATHHPDLVPPLAALATGCAGRSVFRAVGRLRGKESDRLDALARGLHALGARVTADTDTLTVEGGPLQGDANLDPCGDHRIAMALATAALLARHPSRLRDEACVAKSWPGYWDTLARLQGAAP